MAVENHQFLEDVVIKCYEHNKIKKTNQPLD